MEQIGFVKKIEDNRAVLEVKRVAGCGSCKGCSGSCDVKAHVLTLENKIDAKVGDFVELKGDVRNIFKFMIIIYIIPLVFLISGVGVGNYYFKLMGFESYELLSFVTGIVFLAISFFIIRIIDKKIAEKGKETITMIRVL